MSETTTNLLIAVLLLVLVAATIIPPAFLEYVHKTEAEARDLLRIIKSSNYRLSVFGLVLATGWSKQKAEKMLLNHYKQFGFTTEIDYETGQLFYIFPKP